MTAHASRGRRWRTERYGSTGWHGLYRIGRIRVGWRLYRHHRGSHISDRWVLQPQFVYDRKRRPEHV